MKKKEIRAYSLDRELAVQFRTHCDQNQVNASQVVNKLLKGYMISQTATVHKHAPPAIMPESTIVESGNTYDDKT